MIRMLGAMIEPAGQLFDEAIGMILRIVVLTKSAMTAQGLTPATCATAAPGS